MNDLFKKLNVLIKSSVNSPGHTGSRQDEERAPRAPLLGKNLDHEVATLRERVNDAVRYEDELKARLRQLQDEAARWDRQADDAVAQGNDAGARYAVEQMRRAEQRAAMTEVDLQAHERATQDLIQRVNMLDAVVADARRSEAAQSSEPESSSSAHLPVHLPDLGNVLRDAREKITALGEMAAAQRELHSAPAPAETEDDGEVDADLENRRQRLSKR